MRQHASGQRYLWIVVLLSFLGQGGSASLYQGLPPLYIFIKEEFHLSQAQVGLITSTLTGGGIITSLVVGRALDRYGVRWVLPLGLLLLSGVLLVFSQGRSLGQILAIGFLAGTVATVGFPGSSKVVVDWLPVRLRAIGMSLRYTSVPITGSVAAAVLPALALALSWRYAAGLLALNILIAAVVIALFYREGPLARPMQAGRDSFVRQMRRVVRNRNLLIATVFQTTQVSLQIVVVSYLVLFLKEALLFSVVVAGAFLAIVQFSSAGGSMLWGVVSDGLLGGRRVVVLVIVGVLSMLLLLLMALLTPSTPFWMVLLLVIGIGMTVPAWQGVHTALVAEIGGAGLTATALGFTGTFSRAGVLVVPPLFGLLVDLSDGSYRAAWLAAAVLAILGTFSLLLLRESRPQVQPEEPVRPPGPRG
ncbi:MAG: MFS transporter [Dehalococcoidia bacterium]